jgi:hypothetical protein
MPGFLGGSSGSSGTGGEISFPKEFIDPVTKLRVSQPENLIDTDFEYGLQPTKWETVELINNTPSFFSKSGDTTIPNITSIATNSGTREITVITATDHGLAVGIPINVTGTKSVTADGSYVINSIPNLTTFTYLCKDEQIGNNAIEDLYSSIITGEFFQGSQIRIADAEGIITDAEAISTLRITTESTHGFGLNTPFYFLNLNSTISQEFEASNSAAKSFDSSNSATAQTFDGSNTLSTFNIDWSNSGTVGGVTSTIFQTNVSADTITVTHGLETFAGRPVGTPLYYNLTVPASSGYFFDNPRGVVFLKTTNALNSPAGQSTFQVSATPDGTVIDIVSSMSGTFQLANQARAFAGNNLNPDSQVEITIVNETPKVLDAANDGAGITGNRVATLVNYSGSLINTTADSGSLDWYQGTMVQYTADSAASGLTLNATYWVDTFISTGGANYSFTLRTAPGAGAGSVVSASGGTGTQKFTKIGVSLTADVFHIKNNNFVIKDLVKYEYPEGASKRFTVSAGGDELNYYYVTAVYDAHNFQLSSNIGVQATGGTESTPGDGYKYHTFTSTSNLVVSSGGLMDVLVVAGGGGGGGGLAGGGGGGGVLYTTGMDVPSGTYPVVVGTGGAAGLGSGTLGTDGNPSSFRTMNAVGGGGGGHYSAVVGRNGGSGGGGGGTGGGAASGGSGVAGPPRQGYNGGEGNYFGSWKHLGGGGGGANANGAGSSDSGGGNGGNGVTYFGTTFGGGGGGAGRREDGGQPSGDYRPGGTGGTGGGGGGGGSNIGNATAGTDGLGGGGGGGRWENTNSSPAGGRGGNGRVVVRYLA